MGKATLSISNPSGEYRSSIGDDFFKSFARSIVGPDARYWGKEGAIASGWDYEVSKKSIKALTDNGEPHTTLNGKFKFTEPKPPKYSLNLKGSVSSYQRKIANGVPGSDINTDSFTTINATGLRGIKVDKIIKANTGEWDGLYGGKSFLEEAIIGKQKKLDVIINASGFTPPVRDIGKTNYSLVGDFDDPNRIAAFWTLNLGKSKETIDLSKFGDETVTIRNFDPKKDSIIVKGKYFTQGNTIHIETANGSRNIASFTNDANPTLTATPQDITEAFSIKST